MSVVAFMKGDGKGSFVEFLAWCVLKFVSFSPNSAYTRLPVDGGCCPRPGPLPPSRPPLPPPPSPPSRAGGHSPLPGTTGLPRPRGGRPHEGSLRQGRLLSGLRPHAEGRGSCQGEEAWSGCPGSGGGP